MATSFAVPAAASWDSTGLGVMCAAVGLAYGALWSLLPTIVAELFGTADFGCK